MSFHSDWFGDLWGGFTGGEGTGFFGGLGNLLGGGKTDIPALNALFGLGVGSLLQAVSYTHLTLPTILRV